jgi:hypothetical protein
MFFEPHRVGAREGEPEGELVAGWTVTSSIGPSPSTYTLRRARSASRYSAPVRIVVAVIVE